MSSLESPREYEKCAIGIGGTHYPEKLNKTIFYSDMAIGPVIPKHALEHFNKEMLEQILSKSDQNVKFALVDNKGLGKYKQEVMRVLDGSNLEKIIA